MPDNLNILPEDNLEIVDELRQGPFPNDPAMMLCTNISRELFAYYASMEPCQPSKSQLIDCKFPTRQQGDRVRSFHDKYYFKEITPGNFVKRNWLSYSPSSDSVFCIVCKLFGLPSSKHDQFTKHGANDWRHISFKIKIHESTPEHLQSEMRRVMYSSQTRADVQLLSTSNSQVAENREVVKLIFESLLYLARQNIAFRGHDESWSSLNQGNFIELVKFLAKHNPLLSVHLSKMKNSNKNRLTFLSNVSQNKMLNIMGETVREDILKRVKKAGVFSIIIDTTTDVFNLEQFSLVLRFVNNEGQVEERLVAMKETKDASGLGMFNVFCDICNKYDINWETNLCAQSYDGAASMQGKYSGVRSYVHEKNPNAIYVWCFAHILNLVVVDTCDSCVSAKNFFGDVQCLITFMRARKRTAIFVEQQKKCYPSERPSRMKNFSSTRWTSHHHTISVIKNKFLSILKTLEELNLKEDRDTSTTALNLYKSITTFNFILILHLMENIFSCTTPLSLYLQSPNIDFIQAITMVDVCTKKLSNLRDNQVFNNLLDQTKHFADEIGLVECQLPETRIRRRKMMPGEIAADEIITNPNERFKIEVFYVLLDKINTSIVNRYQGAREILSDLSLLTFDRLNMTRKGAEMPEDNFISLTNWIPCLNINNLKMEYSIFASSFMKLYNNMNLDNIHSKNESTFENVSDDSDSENEINSDCHSSENVTGNNIEIRKKLSATEILKMLCTFNLVTAFPNLFIVYKYSCTIPVTSVSSERSFSKLKIIKTRLRSTMKQNRLESLILLSSEKDINIDFEEIINKYALTSSVLQNNLMFK